MAVTKGRPNIPESFLFLWWLPAQSFHQVSVMLALQCISQHLKYFTIFFLKADIFTRNRINTRPKGIYFHILYATVLNKKLSIPYSVQLSDYVLLFEWVKYLVFNILTLVISTFQWPFWFSSCVLVNWLPKYLQWKIFDVVPMIRAGKPNKLLLYMLLGSSLLVHGVKRCSPTATVISQRRMESSSSNSSYSECLFL